MKVYEIEMRGDAREVYRVVAESEEDARESWAGGTLIVSEVTSVDVDTVKLVAESEGE